MDDIAIFNRALTPQEIQNLYQSGTTPTSNKVVWKKLLDGAQFPSTEYFFQPYSFDRSSRKIYSIHSVKKWLYAMDVDNLTFTSIPVSGVPTFDRPGDMLFNPGNNSVQFWRAGTDNVFEVPVAGGAVTQIGSGASTAELFGANPIYNSNTSKPAIIHGYGFFTHKNAAYELTNGTWAQKRPNSAEQPYKRGAYVYPNGDYTKTYIIDGQGNPSGNQLESACSLPGGLPWATDVGKFCWLRDIWEIDLNTWTAKNILPVNSDIDATGRFGYDYKNNAFYSFGGYVPPAVHGQQLTWIQSARRFRPGSSVWENLEASGDLPPSGVTGVTYYDEVKNRFIFCASQGVWEILLSPPANAAPTDIQLSTLDIPDGTTAGSTVATLNAVDDGGGTITWSLVEGQGASDNSSFTVQGNLLKSAVAFSYAAKSTYFIRIRATDGGGLTFEKSFALSVLPPTCTVPEVLSAGNIAFPYSSAVVDKNGNQYLMGAFTGSVQIGSATLLALGGQDIFLVKYDPCGNILWAQGGGSAGNDFPGNGTGLAVDPSGNLFMVGVYQGPLNFPGRNGKGFTAGHSGYADGFVMKLSPEGEVIWGGTVTGGSNDSFYDVAVDANGDAIVGGQFNGCCPASFSATINGVGNALGMSSYSNFYSTAFIAKFSANGAVQWKATLHNRDAENTALAVDGAGNIYAGGVFRSWSSGIQAEFIDASGTKYFLPNPGIGLGYLVKVNGNGNWQWGRPMGNGGDGVNSLTVVGAISLDQTGTPWVAGYYSGGAATFYSTNNNNLSGPASTGNSGFIVRYGADGI
ncbi:MAG: hypothetical protein ACKOAR_13135, partial [Bacteroidota bacterium]